MCTVYASGIHASGSEVNIFSRVVNFASSTRLAKFAKIKPSRNIWRIQYMQQCIGRAFFAIGFHKIAPATEKNSNFYPDLHGYYKEVYTCTHSCTSHVHSIITMCKPHNCHEITMSSSNHFKKNALHGFYVTV